MDEPRWIADEMLGRLARYLRFMGHDTVYAKGLTDEAILERARDDHRVILTRDVSLSGRATASLLLTSVHLADQLRAVRQRFPQFRYAVTMDRCTLCNGRLLPLPPSAVAGWTPSVPPGIVTRGLPVFACEECRHPYWEGSHTEKVRRELSEVFGSP